MAKDKKGFMLYADMRDTFDKLPDDKAAALIRHIFAYVNDENPSTSDLIIDIAFTPIRQQLKRDLDKYKAKCLKNKENAELRWHTNASDGIERNAKHADKDNDNGSDNDNGKENDIPLKKQPVFNFKKSLLDLGVEKQIASDYLKVRTKKNAANTITAFNRIKNQIGKSKLPANECIKIAVEKSWAGFEAEWITNLKNNGRTKEIKSNNTTDSDFTIIRHNEETN